MEVDAALINAVEPSLMLAARLTGGRESLEALVSRCKTLIAPTICSAVWSEGTYFYRCRNCETTPSSSVCVECFKKGNHEGHQFVLETSHFGGCCDCGNPDAWSPNGNCRDHGKKFEGDPVALLPPETREVAPAVIAATFHLLCHNFQQLAVATNETKERLEHQTLLVVKFLRMLSDAEILLKIQRWCCKQPCPVVTSTSTMAKITRSLLHLRGDLLEETQNLILDEIQDGETKLFFARPFSELYLEMLKLRGDKVNENILSIQFRLACQLTNVENIVKEMVNWGFLDNVLETLADLLREAFHSEMRTPHENGSPVLVYPNLEQYQRFVLSHLNDLNSMLESKEILKLLITKPGHFFEYWVSLFEILTGVDAENRRLDVHVETEQAHFDTTISFEMEMLRPLDNICSALAEFGDAETKLARLKLVVSHLLAWIRQQPYFKASVQAERVFIFGHSHRQYSVGTRPFSLHICLVRLLSSMLSHYLGAAPSSTPAVLSSLLTVDEMEYVAELPLLVQVWEAQVANSMWVRNGVSMLSKADTYVSWFLSAANELDLYMLQLACSYLGADQFIGLIVERFGLAHWLFTPHPQPTTPCFEKNQQFLCADRMLSLLINVLGGHTHMQPRATEEQFVREAVIHALAFHDITRSGIEKLVGPLTNAALVNKVLTQVATYIRPTQTKAGVFRLIDDCWSEFNPWYRHYTVDQRQQAIERHSQYRKQKNVTTLLWANPASEPLTSEMPHSESLLRLVLAVMSECRDCTTCTVEPTVSACVYLLWRSLERCTSGSINAGVEDAWCGIVFTLVELLQLSGKKEGSSPPASLCPDIKASAIALVTAAQSAFAAVHDQLALQLPDVAAHLQDEALQAASGGLFHTEAEQRKALAKKRQAALLEKMKQQQAQFLSTSTESATSAADKVETTDDGTSAGEQQICVLCRQQAAPFSTSEAATIDNDGDAEDSTEKHILVRLALANTTTAPWTARFKASFPHLWGNVDGEQWDVPKTTIPNQNGNWYQGTYCPEDQSQQEQAAGLPQFHNVELFRAVKISGCGHMMHFHCLMQYCEKTHPHCAIESPSHGVVLCPLCSRLSNLPIPVFSSTRLKELRGSVSGDVYAWLTETTLAEMVTEYMSLAKPSKDELFSVAYMVDMCHRVMIDKRKIDTENFEPLEHYHVMINSLATSLMCSEICLRSPDVPKNYWPRECATLQTLSAACHMLMSLSMASPSFRGELTDHMASLCQWLTGGEVAVVPLNAVGEEEPGNVHTSSEEGEASPHNDEGTAAATAAAVVSTAPPQHADAVPFSFSVRPVLHPETDLFTVLVRVGVHYAGTDHFGRLLHIVLACHIAQILVHLLQNNPYIALSGTQCAPLEVWAKTIATHSLAPPGHVSKEAALWDIGDPSHPLRQLLADKSVSLSQTVASLATPFLRRVALYYFVRQGKDPREPLPAPLASETAVLHSDVAGLCHLIGLDSLDDLCQNESLTELLPKLCEQYAGWLHQTQPHAEADPVSVALPLAPAIPCNLIPLPETFQDFLVQLHGVVCKSCGTRVSTAALCLSCGTLLCLRSDCCTNEQGLGEAYTHAMKCGGGVCAFLMFHYSIVMVVSKSRRSFIANLYLDDYGEPDVNLKRGKILHLAKAAYSRLQHALLNASVELDCDIRAAEFDNDAKLW
eukprot:TRINITY_DN2403_c0_g1_i3.p1 TRINITY_DN2403_c0_g1~~TRINITY_DN2403_c0_g1_i3.p1  ORF type:complete len:1676 (+),score=339.79 TRINITY_DN2403_c0_g1_i3:54-5030(+)